MCTFLKFIYIIKHLCIFLVTMMLKYLWMWIDDDGHHNLPGISPCGLLRHATFFVGFQNFSSCLAYVLLFSILLTYCFQLVWQVYINMMIYHHGLISSNYDEMVTLSWIGSQSLISLKTLYCVDLRPGIGYGPLLEILLILFNS
jgi:hypothetical protein